MESTSLLQSIYDNTQHSLLGMNIYTAIALSLGMSLFSSNSVAEPARTASRDYPSDPPAEASDVTRWPAELKVSGNRVVNPNGDEVWLQGVAIPGLEIRPEGHGAVRSTIEAIENWNANVVRLAIREDFWFGKGEAGKETEGQSDGGAAYRATVDAVVNAAANRSAYLVIDLHRYRAIKDEHLQLWSAIAQRYKNHPAVLFDLINEPHTITWDVWRDGGFVPLKDKQTVDESAFLSEANKRENEGFTSPGMQAAVNHIRSYGANNIIIAGGLDWAYDLSGIAEGYELQDTPEGNGIMYSAHIYPWKKDWAKQVLRTAEKHPIFIGEVGVDIKKMSFLPLERQEDYDTWAPDVLGFIQKHRLNWTGWSFHTWATPVILADWDYSPTYFWGQYVKDALAGKQFELKQLR